jgi:hypothetical protein
MFWIIGLLSGIVGGLIGIQFNPDPGGWFGAIGGMSAFSLFGLWWDDVI